MAEEPTPTPFPPEDINPIFELYSILKDTEDEKFTDAEIRRRLKELKPKLKILFSPPPPTK
jgi:hypothetical protein